MLRSYCTCGWNGLDDENDTNFDRHVLDDMNSIHRMCSYGEHELCRELYNKNNIINNLESQLESNCSEEVIILREKVLLLEKQVEMLKQKLYANTNNGGDGEHESSGPTKPTNTDASSSSVSEPRSRLSKRRSS